MGRIPKLVKEKALAEYMSSSIENEDPTQANPPRIPPLRLNSNNLLSTSALPDMHLPLLDEHSLFADLDSVPIDNQMNCHTPLMLPTTAPTSSLYHTYQLPENFSIDETKPEHIEDDQRIVKLDPTALSNYMTNCDERFAGNVIERMKCIVEKISHPTPASELDYEQSSFIRHLRWKMFDLVNTYNGRTRQLVERMNSMIRLGICDFPGNSSSLQDIWAGLTGLFANQILINHFFSSDAIPFHVKNLIAFAREVSISGPRFHYLIIRVSNPPLKYLKFENIRHRSLIRSFIMSDDRKKEQMYIKKTLESQWIIKNYVTVSCSPRPKFFLLI